MAYKICFYETNENDDKFGKWVSFGMFMPLRVMDVYILIKI